MLWLGRRRGYVADWFTQQWVRATGRCVELRELPWLVGPAGKTDGIGPGFIEIYAAENDLKILDVHAPRGLEPPPEQAALSKRVAAQLQNEVQARTKDKILRMLTQRFRGRTRSH